MHEEKLSKGLKANLTRTYYLDVDHPQIRETTARFLRDLPEGDVVQIAVALFYFVRDEVKYVVKSNLGYYRPQNLKASQTLARGYGYCIQKSVLLAALARAAGIPSRLHFVDIVNYMTPQKFIDRIGSDLFIYHAYPELSLNGKWVEANVAFDRELCLRKNYPLVEFDGVNPGMFAKKDSSGEQFVRYVSDHGVFKDVPFLRIMSAWIKGYGMKGHHFRGKRA